MGNESHRRGFTKIELIVVVVLLVIVFAVLLPLIQHSRESARRTQCLNNLKQLGLAAQSETSALGRFPVSSIHVKKDAAWSPLLSRNGWSWCIDLEPYTENRNYELPDGRPLDGTPRNAQLLATVIDYWHCPSFEGSPYVDPKTKAEAITNYKALGATHLESLNVASRNPTAPRYAPDSDRHPDGVIYPGSRHSIDDVSDGTSRTILFVETVEQNVARWTVGNETCLVALPPTVTFEKVAASYWHPTDYTADQFWGNSTIPATINKTYLNWDYDAIPYDDGGISTPSAAASGPIKYGPSSHHKGVTNHGFADGSVHSINNDIDAALYMFLTTRNSGDPAPKQQ